MFFGKGSMNENLRQQFGRPRRKQLMTKEAKLRKQKRLKVMSEPITAEEIIAFANRLRTVNHGTLMAGDKTVVSQCWIYPSKGEGKGYGSHSRKGHSIGAHRFALAIKEGCTPNDLENFHAGHAPREHCIGYRCCNPAHLLKQPSPINRSFGRDGQKPE